VKANAVVALARQDLDDMAEPYLWTTPVLLGYLAEAQQEACMRADLLWDATSTFCAVAVTASTATVAVDSRINRVVWAGWDNGTSVQPLAFMDDEEAERASPRWRTSVGTPMALISKPKAVRLYLPPAAAGTLRLEVYRQPLLSTLLATSDLEVADRHAHLLLDWVVYRAFGTRDADKTAAARAMAAEARFNASFGMRPTSYAQASRQQRRNPNIRPSGF